MCSKKQPFGHSVRAALVGAGLILIGGGHPARADWQTQSMLPNVAASGVEGQVPALAGKVVIVDFWASWCGPCKKSFPELDKLNETFGPKGVVVLGVSVDDRAADMQKFLTAHPVSFAVVRDGQHALVKAAGVQSMPTSFVVDRTGVIRFIHSGFFGAKTVQAYTEEIEQLLRE